ncbi:MAG: hypothetical protein JWO46_2371, partial [Nocardioidaceae bacterium]|nr:hypothetical protein [Nocardioidaceae bacterium]
MSSVASVADGGSVNGVELTVV